MRSAISGPASITKQKIFLSSFTINFRLSVSICIVYCVVYDFCLCKCCTNFLVCSAIIPKTSYGKRIAPEIQFSRDNVAIKIKLTIIKSSDTALCYARKINFSYLSLFKYNTHLQFAYAINSFVSISFNSVHPYTLHKNWFI